MEQHERIVGPLAALQLQQPQIAQQFLPPPGGVAVAEMRWIPNPRFAARHRGRALHDSYRRGLSTTTANGGSVNSSEFGRP